MAEPVLITVFAVFAWWASTGAVLFLAHRAPSTFKWTLAGATVLLVAGFAGLYATRDNTSVAGAYAGFSFGLIVWAWQEVTFYTGAVTGPRKQRCPAGCSGVAHFGHAVMVSLYHELSILVTLLVILALTWGAANQIGLWTFVVLLVMHESARLNVLLGVQNLSEEFVPEHLAVLRGFLSKKPMNLLFPLSVTASTVVAVMLVQRAASPQATPFDAAGATFLCVLLVLAIVEHWFLVVPLPSSKLWAWSLTAPGPNRAGPETAEPVIQRVGLEPGCNCGAAERCDQVLRPRRPVEVV